MVGRFNIEPKQYKNITYNKYGFIATLLSNHPYILSNHHKSIANHFCAPCNRLKVHSNLPRFPTNQMGAQCKHSRALSNQCLALGNHLKTLKLKRGYIQWYELVLTFFWVKAWIMFVLWSSYVPWTCLFDCRSLRKANACFKMQIRNIQWIKLCMGINNKNCHLQNFLHGLLKN